MVVAWGADALIVQGDLVLAAGLDLGAGLGDAGEAVPIKTACCGAAAGGEGEDAACVGCDQEAGGWGLACEGDGAVPQGMPWRLSHVYSRVSETWT